MTDYQAQLNRVEEQHARLIRHLQEQVEQLRRNTIMLEQAVLELNAQVQADQKATISA